MSDEQEPQQPANDGNAEDGYAVVVALQAEVAELKDRLLRALADAQNTRRIAEREKQDATQYAVTRFARDMLAVSDNFSRALAACPPDKLAAADPQVRGVIEGVEVTERQLLSTLETHGVKAIDTSDGKFDPNLHQAIAEVPGNGKPAGSIVDVVQTGFTISGRLLRPAMVTVARRDDGAGVDTKA
ncbi:MAG TPA: nucleotide exchange factor GrpE [Rhizomicrobium sp.]|jgi:molecular chaperone GrpE